GPVPQTVARVLPHIPACTRLAGPPRPARTGSAPDGHLRTAPPRGRSRPARGTHVPARRVALPRRTQGPRKTRIPGRTRRTLCDLPRLGVVQETTPLRHGRRTGGDVQTVGPHGRQDRTRVGRRRSE